MSPTTDRARTYRTGRETKCGLLVRRSRRTNPAPRLGPPELTARGLPARPDGEFSRRSFYGGEYRPDIDDIPQESPWPFPPISPGCGTRPERTRPSTRCWPHPSPRSRASPTPMQPRCSKPSTSRPSVTWAATSTSAPLKRWPAWPISPDPDHTGRSAASHPAHRPALP